MSLLLKEQCACDGRVEREILGRTMLLGVSPCTTWNEVGFQPTLVAPGSGPREGPAGVQAWC